MTDKEKMKKMADLFRESADILDELSEDVSEERAEELAGMYIVKMLKIQELS